MSMPTPTDTPPHARAVVRAARALIKAKHLHGLPCGSALVLRDDSPQYQPVLAALDGRALPAPLRDPLLLMLRERIRDLQGDRVWRAQRVTVAARDLAAAEREAAARNRYNPHGIDVWDLELDGAKTALAQAQADLATHDRNLATTAAELAAMEN